MMNDHSRYTLLSTREKIDHLSAQLRDVRHKQGSCEQIIDCPWLFTRVQVTRAIHQLRALEADVRRLQREIDFWSDVKNAYLTKRRINDQSDKRSN